MHVPELVFLWNLVEKETYCGYFMLQSVNCAFVCIGFVVFVSMYMCICILQRNTFIWAELPVFTSVSHSVITTGFKDEVD